MMRILNRSEFLALKGEHVFAKYNPCCSHDLRIFTGRTGTNDFQCQEMGPVGLLECTGSSDMMDKLSAMEKDSYLELPIDCECEGRDGMYDNGQLFIVLSRLDVMAIIKRLVGTL